MSYTTIKHRILVGVGYSVILIGVGLAMPNFRKSLYDMMLMLAPKFARAFSSTKSSIEHGMIKPPGSFILHATNFKRQQDN